MAICNCSNITHDDWGWNSPSGCPADPALCSVDKIALTDGPFAPATIGAAYATINGSQKKEDACSLRKTLKDVLNNSSWVKKNSVHRKRASKLRTLLCDIVGITCDCASKLDPANTPCYDADLADKKNKLYGPRLRMEGL